MAEKGSGSTRPGAVDAEEGRKGTAAADPVLMVTPNGTVSGSVVQRSPDGEVEALVSGREVGTTVTGKIVPKDQRSPAEIEADLYRTREHLSSTLDELSERLSPRDLARRGGLQVKGQFVDLPTGHMRTGRVAAVGGGLAGAVVAMILLRKFGRRSHDG